MSNDVTLAAGTIVSYSLDLDTPVFVKLEGALSVGAMGEMAEPKEKTQLSDLVKKYSAGMKDSPDKTIKGQYMGSDADQKAFLQAANETKDMLIKIECPDKPDDTGTGTVIEFELATLGMELDEVTNEDWMMFTVKGKQNSFDITYPVAGV